MKKLVAIVTVISFLTLSASAYAFSWSDFFKLFSNPFSTVTYIIYSGTPVIDKYGCGQSEMVCPSNQGYVYCVYNFTSASYHPSTIGTCGAPNPGQLSPGQSLCPATQNVGWDGSMHCQLWGVTSYLQTQTVTSPSAVTISLQQSYSFSTLDIVSIPLTVNGVNDGTIVTGTLNGITQSVAVSQGTAVLSFGKLPQGAYTATFSASGATATTSVKVNAIFSSFSLSPANSLSQPPSSVQFNLLITDQAGNGLSITRNEVTLSGTAVYSDGTNALAMNSYIGFQELGGGNYLVSFTTKQITGQVILTISASKTNYQPQSKSAVVNVVVPGLYIDVSQIPIGASPGDTITIPFTTKASQYGTQIDADDVVVTVTSPTTSSITTYTLSQGNLLHGGTGQYSFSYTFSSNTKEVELYRISITANANSKGYGANTAAAGISVYPGVSQTTTTTQPCIGSNCGGGGLDFTQIMLIIISAAVLIMFFLLMTGKGGKR